jgi:hypothetical protein
MLAVNSGMPARLHPAASVRCFMVRPSGTQQMKQAQHLKQSTERPRACCITWFCQHDFAAAPAIEPFLPEHAAPESVLQVAKGLGPIATVIVRSGTLRLGDPIVVGTEHGKVSASCTLQY